ncbi:hypothetical protein [Ancylobacter sp.]|uniref:hypothetical protein n=1 Tax=Ancylobacter sp. TaxID=1872567 RepID=UPI003D0FD2E3
MLTVVTPAESTALTTVERAKALVDFGSLSDEAISLLIEHASAAVSDVCRRIFPLQTYRETFDCEDIRGAEFMLGRGPVIEISTVILGCTPLPPTGYQADGQWLRRAGGCRLWGEAVDVTYKAGFNLSTDGSRTLPLPVERAVALEAAAYHASRDRDELLKSETVEDIGAFSYRVPGGDDRLTSPTAAQLLRPYIVPMMG